MSSKSVLLLSGGMESLVISALFREHHPCSLGYAFFVDYGQRAAAKERRAVERISREYGFNLEVTTMSLPFLSSHVLVDEDAIVVEGAAKDGAPNLAHIVPARNLVFLSAALSYGLSIGAEEIHTGFDFTGRPESAKDKSLDFVCSFVDLQATLTDEPLKVRAPLHGYAKTKTAKLGKDLGVDWSLSWSCYNALSLPCGLCAPCVARGEALRAIGVTEKTCSAEDVLSMVE